MREKIKMKKKKKIEQKLGRSFFEGKFSVKHFVSDKYMYFFHL